MEPVISVTARCEIRAVIRLLHAKKLEPIDIYRQLSEIYVQKCISVQHVRKWCREFSNGCTDIHDEKRSGRLSISDETVEKIERILLEDRKISIKEMALRVTEVSEASTKRILTEKLDYHKICARWVPHMLTAEQKQQRVDCAHMCFFKNASKTPRNS
ncbi:uncharacterized protein LOC108913710 [Anoplophora glabripennis]|uniref:uncharacterized protein LOC108913710 n=1 Tax=Anoplophora glabripennis TaxID=217634 RepID=UPI0008741F6C|nr:uncharacterized protein LOC108913710 [Anoplophora glabripennis]